MKLNISLHEAHPVLHIVVTGQLTEEGLVGFFGKITSNKNWRSGMPILEDISGCDASKLDLSIVRSLVDEFALYQDQFAGCRVAVVSPHALHFGQVRQFMTLVDLKGIIPPQIFKNESDAITWLLS